MMELNHIERLYEKKALIRYGIFLLNAKDATDFITECQKQSVVILGIDVFKITGNTIQPLLEISVDFTMESKNSQNVDDFLEALSKVLVNDNLFYEIVIE